MKDRLPPNSPEAEMGVIGCIMLDPNGCLPQCIERIGKAEAFYDLRHQTLYGILVEMFDNRQAIDIITVYQQVKDRKLIEQLGGIGAISQLHDAVPSAANLPYYLDILIEFYTRRRIVQVGTEIAQRAQDFEGQIETLVDEVERDINAISQAQSGKAGTTIKQLVGKAISKIEEFHQNQGALTGIGTGFVDLDKMTSGLHDGEMIVIAARPSIGKTSLACCIAEHVAINQRLPVGVFSLEMTSESLVMRALCSLARVNLRNVRAGYLAERDFPKLTVASGKLASAPLYIDDTSGLSILQLRAKARRMQQQHGVKLFIIDYLQLLHSTSRKAKNRQEEISDISSGIKSLAKELNVPVIVLAQLNREIEKDKKRAPRMSDLRESGSIEQDADLVGLLYKPEADDGAREQNSDGEAVNLLIAKQRNGPAGEAVNLTFLKSITRFESAAKFNSDDVP